MFEMLEIGDPRWVSSIMNLDLNRRDLHFDQRFLAPYVAAYRYKAYLGLTTRPEGYIVEPLLTTPEGDLKHATNFGGPTASLDSTSSLEHTESLLEWAENRGFKSQYVTLVPSLAKNQLKLLASSGIEPEYRKQSVIVDLNDQKIRGTTRRLANKAQTAGVSVKNYSLDNLRHFIDM